MSRPRLYVPDDLAADARLTLGKDQSHYLAHVMRIRVGEQVALFNGRDGEWRAEVTGIAKAGLDIHVIGAIRGQAPEPDLWLLAAVLKKDCTDLVAEKAAELGVSALWPVFTRRTVAARVNTARLAARLTEAAEQCERLSVPELKEPAALDQALANWDPARPLIFLDERGLCPPALEALAELPPGPLALLVGPEGGFAPEEHSWLCSLPFARPVALGPRILRAETAAIAALSIVQAIRGDWSRAPRG